jgi:ribosomal protein S12 methylthiotransferase
MSFAFSAVNLGCNKNMVDLEFAIWEILKLQNEYEVEYFETPEDADYVIVNTCGFLSSARAESENTVRYFDNLGKRIIVMGCYIPVENDNFFSKLKNLYKIVPFIDYSNVEELVTGQESEKKRKPSFSLAGLKKAKLHLVEKNEDVLEDYLENIEKKKWENAKAFIWKGNETRAYFNAPYGYEYLKIAEGCDNNCSFCIIPKIRGKQKSRDMESILTEVWVMVQSGIKEIQILSQDTTRYGTDLYGEPRLFELLEKIDAFPGDFTYKVFYLYPDILTLEHMKKLKNLTKFVPYFDIPFQHISPRLLKRMGRFYDEIHIKNMLDFMRSEFPQSFIHTNFIIGFPGETDEDFAMLLDFIREYQFESISFFEYHDEELAASSKLTEKVPHEVALTRLEEVQKLVEEIYKKNLKKRQGRELVGYIMEDTRTEDITIRWELQAPEIDEYDIVKRKNILSENIALWEKVVYKL